MRLLGGILLFGFVGLVVWAMLNEFRGGVHESIENRRASKRLYREWLQRPGEIEKHLGVTIDPEWSDQRIKKQLYSGYVSKTRTVIH
jgi:hypothetical protein